MDKVLTASSVLMNDGWVDVMPSQRNLHFIFSYAIFYVSSEYFHIGKLFCIIISQFTFNVCLKITNVKFPTKPKGQYSPSPGTVVWQFQISYLSDF